MSYSFGVKAKTKKELKASAAVEVAKVVAMQTVHAKDNLAILKTCNAFVDLIEAEPKEDEVYFLDASGSLSATLGGDSLTGGNISIRTGITLV